MIRLVDEKTKEACVHFESLLDLMDAECGTVNKYRFNYYLREYREGPSKFGPGNYKAEDVINKALIGSPELYDSLKGKVKTLNKDETEMPVVIKKRKRKKTRAAQGDELDIHKVYAGKLDKAWTTTKAIEMDKVHSLITVFIDIGGNWNVDARDSLWRAAVAVSLVDKLILAGKSVRVIVGGASEYATMSSPLSTTSVTVKEYNEPLPLERLAAMSHIGFYRTAMFAAKAMHESKLTSGLGRSSKYIKHKAPLFMRDEMAKGHTKYIYIPRCVSEFDAVQAVKNIYKQF